MGRIVHFETLDSTNTYALEHYDELEDGSLVTADAQTAGRGRLGRKWLSEPGSLFASFVMKDLFGEIFSATMVSSLAVLSVLKEFAPSLDAYIKWPNDVFVGKKKLCGILCEGVVRNGKLSGMICGIGVNVNIPQHLLDGVGQPASSVLAETGFPTDLEAFRDRLLVFLNWYYVIGTNNPEELFRSWRNANTLTGKTVTLVPVSGKAKQATVKDIRTDGKLIVICDGKEEIFDCGDVKIDL